MFTSWPVLDALKFSGTLKELFAEHVEIGVYIQPKKKSLGEKSDKFGSWVLPLSNVHSFHDNELIELSERLKPTPDYQSVETGYMHVGLYFQAFPIYSQ